MSKLTIFTLSHPQAKALGLFRSKVTPVNAIAVPNIYNPGCVGKGKYSEAGGRQYMGGGKCDSTNGLMHQRPKCTTLTVISLALCINIRQ